MCVYVCVCVRERKACKRVNDESNGIRSIFSLGKSDHGGLMHDFFSHFKNLENFNQTF